jgi:uncharacterized protein with ParB-like and HNH nuclease domain
MTKQFVLAKESKDKILIIFLVEFLVLNILFMVHLINISMKLFIDGQQRIATFTLLVACLIKFYKTLESDAKKSGDNNNLQIIERRSKELFNRFIEFEQEIQRVVTPVEVLKLSKSDHSFYE